MSSSLSNHDTLAFRLADILLKLNLGEPFSRAQLAEEFKVSERTIYRDLNRLNNIVERLPNGHYQLSSDFRGKLTTKDLKTFVKVLGTDHLYPDSSSKFLNSLIDSKNQSSFLVKGHQYEKPDDLKFKQLDDAIQNHQTCLFFYKEKLRLVNPYRLINQYGIWYLAATENEQLKAFSLSRISKLSTEAKKYVPESQIIETINRDEDIWFTNEKFDATFKISRQIAYYFERRKVLPGQISVEKEFNGDLVIKSKVSHTNQILPLVRYWIPQIKILHPRWLREILENDLRDYLSSINQNQ